MADNDRGAISPIKAAAAISAFLTVEGDSLSPQQVMEHIGVPSSMEHPDLGTVLTFRGPLGTIWVSPRGNVVYYAGNGLRSAGRPVPPAEAMTVAIRFVEREVSEFATRNFQTEPPKFDRTRATFRWVEKPRTKVETAIFPNWAEVVLDLSQGRVVRFNASDLRLVRTTPPAVSEEQARARIKARFQKAAIEEIELVQIPAKAGTGAITVWNAMVMTLAPEGPVVVRVTINADTGDVVP